MLMRITGWIGRESTHTDSGAVNSRSSARREPAVISNYYWTALPGRAYAGAEPGC